MLFRSGFVLVSRRVSRGFRSRRLNLLGDFQMPNNSRPATKPWTNQKPPTTTTSRPVADASGLQSPSTQLQKCFPTSPPAVGRFPGCFAVTILTEAVRLANLTDERTIRQVGYKLFYGSIRYLHSLGYGTRRLPTAVFARLWARTNKYTGAT